VSRCARRPHEWAAFLSGQAAGSFSCVLGRWVAIDLFRRLEPDWKSPVGKETLDDGGCNGNRILGDRRNYRVRDRLHRCSEPSETQRGAWTPTCHVRRGARSKRARGRFAGAKKNL